MDTAQNQPQENNVSQPSVQTSQPMPNSTAEPTQSNKSQKNILFILISLFVLLLIIGITLFLYLQNQQGTLFTEEVVEEEIAIPITPLPSLNPEQTLEEFGVVCRRYTTVEAALEEPQVACDLDLSGQDLSALPAEIVQLQNLNSINLSNNNFSQFPTLLYNFPNLLSIDLSNNNLSSIPNDVTTRIPSLQSLILTGNNLSTQVVAQYLQITPAPPQPMQP